MRIQWLGTAAAEGWPGVFCECDSCNRARQFGGKNIRTRSSILVDGKYKIDLPPDTYHHVLTYGLNLAMVECLLVTHSHGDHLNPWEMEMRTPPFAHFKDRPLAVYGNESVRDAIFAKVPERSRSFTYEVVEPFRWYPIPGGRFMPLKADHDPGQMCLFYLLEISDKCLLVANDTGYFPEESWDALKGAKLAIASLDCTNGPIPPGRRGHMGFDCNCEVRERLLAMGCADHDTAFVATHFSHNGGLLHHEMEEILGPRGFSVAYDGMIREI